MHQPANMQRRHALGIFAASAGFASQAFGQSQTAVSAYPGTAIGRNHTDFIQSQTVQGRVLGQNNSQPGVEGVALSYNAKGDKAVTVLFKYPANWSMPKPHYVNSDQEFLILEGSVTFDDVTYNAGDYAYLPAGYFHKLMASKDGCTMLNFYEGEHLAFYQDTPAGMYIADKLIKKIDTKSLMWTPLNDANGRALGLNVQMKLLRADAATGESTFLIKADADQPDAKTARHTATHAAVEEMYVLDGEISSPRGTMKTGAYVWRAPGVARGPYGSKTGYVAILRSKGGALNTTLSAAPEAVVWDNPYSPTIAEAARASAFKPYDPAQKY
jgi:quercetin dioxygenase-like cupin family protein